MPRGGEGGKERTSMIWVFSALLILIGSLQFCQTQNINILNRLCRELTRLSRSKHTLTLVNILTLGEIEHP